MLAEGGVGFEEDLLDELERLVEQETGFHVSDHELKFYGQCQECLKMAGQ